MKLKDLKTITDELNDLFDLDPPIDTEEGEDSTVEMTVEALELVEKKDKPSDFKSYALIEEFVGEYTDQLSEKAINALAFIDITPPTDVEDKDVVRDDDPVPDNLADQIEEAETLKELKSIAKDLDEFKDMRDVLTKYKTKEDLRTAMLEHLEEPDPPVKKEKPTPTKKPSQKSNVVGIEVGAKVTFTPAATSKLGSKELVGTVEQIKADGNGKEYALLATSKGKAWKRITALTLKK